MGPVFREDSVLFHGPLFNHILLSFCRALNTLSWCRTNQDPANANEFQLSFALRTYSFTQFLIHLPCGWGGLAYPCSQTVQKVALRCIQLFDAAPGSAGSQHTQSRRFCDPHFEGLLADPTDVPLRPILDRLAAGSATLIDLMSDSTPAVRSLFHWLSAFRFVGVPSSSFSPPARWGLLDFMSVDFRLPPPSASSGPQPRPSMPSVPCHT